MAVDTITPDELAARRGRGDAVELIDVRTPAEFGEVHADLARNVPLDRLDPLALPAGRTVYVICRTGARGRQACERLAAAGREAVNVDGGTLAWDAAGLPVIRGRRAVSLERQVRIAAGSLALIGAVLALAVHPSFAGLSAFVGAGLVFAGVTDTCGMGLVLARMPWNRAPAGAAGDRGAGCQTLPAPAAPDTHPPYSI
jgi:rhodanese-related sulfurtransferase